ncbi:MAG: major capsid protein [Chloroflexi bacterium]|nr:major capsid protein [Chloroflexota bacterium]
MALTTLDRYMSAIPSRGVLTARAQTVSPNDDGRLLWPEFFPRRDVPSVTVRSYSSRQFRPVGDRREWNQRGRLIPRKLGPLYEIKMVPIETFFSIDEEEMQELIERFAGNAGLIAEQLEVDVPERTDGLVEADYRRIELDCFRAWASGQIVAIDPEDGTQQTMSYGFDAGRYPIASPTWVAAASAYDSFLAAAVAARDSMGSVEGAMMRQATVNAILADAPNPVYGTVGPIGTTIAQLETLAQDHLGGAFTIFVNERTLEVFNDGGTATTSTKIWPAEQVAFIPAGGTVGYTAFAPVARAYEVSQAEPEARIDVRGVTVYHSTSNGGRHLDVEAQVNAMPIPDENRVYVVDAGV